MRVLMLVGGGYYQPPMLNADTNRENNPIYIALGHAYKQPLIHILYRKCKKIQNILDLTISLIDKVGLNLKLRSDKNGI